MAKGAALETKAREKFAQQKEKMAAVQKRFLEAATGEKKAQAQLAELGKTHDAEREQATQAAVEAAAALATASTCAVALLADKTRLESAAAQHKAALAATEATLASSEATVAKAKDKFKLQKEKMASLLAAAKKLQEDKSSGERERSAEQKKAADAQRTVERALNEARATAATAEQATAAAVASLETCEQELAAERELPKADARLAELEQELAWAREDTGGECEMLRRDVEAVKHDAGKARAERQAECDALSEKARTSAQQLE